MSGDALQRFLELASLPRVRHLNLAHNYVRYRGADALARSRQLNRLETLDLDYNYIGPEGAESLARSPFVARLRRLVLSSNGLDPRAMRALVGAAFDELTELDLSANHIQGHGLETLTTAPWFGQIERLDISGNHLQARGAQALARCAESSLRRLDLRFDDLGDDGGQALARVPWLGTLRHLGLAQNKLGGVALGAIGAHLDEIESLDVSYNSLGRHGIDGLSAVPGGALRTLRAAACSLDPRDLASQRSLRWPELTELDLSDNPLDRAALSAIDSAAPDIEVLTLAGTGLDASALDAWRPNVDRLRTLVLDRCPLGARGATILASLSQSGWAPESLSLRACGLGATALDRLCAGDLSRVRTLDLAGNPVGDGLSSLLEHATCDALVALDLANAELPALALRVLARSRRLDGLDTLVLAANPFGPSGLRALADTRSLRPRRLALSRCGLGASSASALAGSSLAERCQDLDLSDNALGSKGAAALARAVALRGVRRLDLARNGIGESGGLALAQSEVLSGLEWLSLKGNPLGAVATSALRGSPALRYCHVHL